MMNPQIFKVWWIRIYDKTLVIVNPRNQTLDELSHNWNLSLVKLSEFDVYLGFTIKTLVRDWYKEIIMKP